MRNWTAEEDAMVLAHKRGDCEIPGRTTFAVWNRRYLLRRKRAGNHAILWTDSEKRDLLEGRPVPGRSKRACDSKRRELLDLPKAIRKWSEEEDAVLVANAAMGVKEIPGRTAEACKHRRKSLGIVLRRPPKPENEPKEVVWTAEDDAALIEAASRGVKEIPGKSAAACNSRRCRLRKLGVEVPIISNRQNGPVSTWRAIEDAMIMRGDRQIPGRTWKGVIRRVEMLRAKGFDVPLPFRSWKLPGYLTKVVQAAPAVDHVIRDPLAAAVWKATRDLPPFLAEVARSELTIAILEGRADAQAITQADVRNATKAGGDQIKVGRFGHASLYAPRSGTEGLTWLETLAA